VDQKYHTPGIISYFYNIVCHKGNTIATVMATILPNVMFRRDLISSKLVA
jgi:hypothetical protein